MTTIINLTPHPVNISSLTLPPSGTIARAGEYVEVADPITADDGTVIPTSWVTYMRVDDLPEPRPDTYYVVSLVVAQAAAATHRSTADLLTPGEQIRDDKGRIVGCKSLARVGRGIPSFRWRDQREAFATEVLRQGGSSNVAAEREVGNLGRYARNYASAMLAEPATREARPGDLVTFFCTTRRGRGVQLTGVPFSTIEEMDAAYALLASAGATCNDASADDRASAAAAVSGARR